MAESGARSSAGNGAPRAGGPQVGGAQVLASAANGAIDLMRAMGGDPDRILGRAGIEPRLLDHPYNEVSLGRYCALFEEAARETRYDNFGLRFGHRFAPKRLGALGYMAVNSPSMRAALHVMAAYFPAHQQNSTFALREEGDLCRLEYQITDGRILRRRQDAELSLGMFCNVFWHCLGRGWRPLELHFEHPRPAEAREHESLFDAPAFFGQPTNAILFRRADLDRPMPEADPYLYTLLEPYMRGRRERARPDDLVGAVRQRILTRLPGGNASVRRVAGDLGLSSWALHRRLNAARVGFNDLLRGARRELALRYVAEPHIALTEVALMLGYSELSAFSRAFRQWTGMAPARYRRQHAEERANPGRDPHDGADEDDLPILPPT